MTDIDFMCEMCHVDDLLAQMTEEEKFGLVLLFISGMRKAKETVSNNADIANKEKVVRHD